MKKPNDMKFTTLLTNLIVEDSRTQFLHDKYVYEPKKGEKPDPNKKGMPYKIFKEIIKADPTTKFPQGFDFEVATYEDLKDKVNAGKYTEWILKSLFNMKPDSEDVKKGSPEYNREMAEKVRLFMEDLFKVNDDLVKFTKYKAYFPQDKRDINKFSSPEELFRFLQSFQLPEKKKKELEKKELKKEIRKEREGFNHPGAETVFVGDNYTVVKIQGDGPKQKEAAGWYGGYYDHDAGESRWCTSPPNSSYFHTYIKQGPLYVILANNDNGKVGKRTGLPQERYQWHFESNQFMDRDDHQIDLVNFLTGPGAELRDLFKQQFLTGSGDVNAANQDVSIKTSSKSGRALAIYGFDELFENLPANITKLSIENDTNAEITVDIPESIGDLKKLRVLTLIKIAKSIPESIGNCSALMALSLTNNPNLTTIPNSLVNLPKLEFVNLRGSNNVEVSDVFKEHFDEANNGLWYKIGVDDDDDN